jgi:RHH-type proline utilization regulon transcriptional repressor/proline dehydrogenase/delta 1-pyrroline-5-carboxylate dehydrogenase
MATGPRFVFDTEPGPDVDGHWLGDESALQRALLTEARLPAAEAAQVRERAAALVRAVRARDDAQGARGSLDHFLQEFSLDSQEGVLLMCLAEALLRVPDAGTADALIADKLGGGRWQDHLGDSESLLVNASTWGLLLTGRLVAPDAGRLTSLVARLGEPLIRAALRQAMRILAHQFVFGRDIDEALARAASPQSARYRHSFDMLGEAAITAADAARYLQGYHAAIARIGAAADPVAEVLERPGISVKLSALHPRYEPAQRERVRRELLPRLLGLVHAARAAGLPLTLDAEESERLDLSLELFAAVLADGPLGDYAGLGLAVQAYQKRAPAVLDWLAAQARAQGCRITVRLVKGAYWDTEIKQAQERGLAGFPVYTRKAATDVAYLACARRLAAYGDCIYPQFATHNAHTVAWVEHLYAGRAGAYEFQRLHGMGEALYASLQGESACRVYAPVGAHRDLLPYLVRRLLENGANTSFVNRIADARVPEETVARDPSLRLAEDAGGADTRICLPGDLYAPERRNSAGVNLASVDERRALERACEAVAARGWSAVAGGPAATPAGTPRACRNPARPADVVGEVRECTVPGVAVLAARAHAAHAAWEARGGAGRAAVLERAADLLEAGRAGLVARCVLEAGRTVPDALSEQREAVDLLRYYAAGARRLCDAGQALPGVAGEANALVLRGRGVFACISPWNFPVAIFAGQIAAALAAGNAVVAKPAGQTPLCGAAVIELLHEAGVPPEVLQFAPGGADVGAALVADPRVAGVAFTGSVRAAASIARALTARTGELVPLIAETGGINALVADSSALPEQLVQDAVTSAFNSAGQRCSAARLLFVQQDIADRVLELLAGAMDELVVGDPARLRTDVGPVIDVAAQARLREWRERLRATSAGRWWHALREPDGEGHWFAPLAAEIGEDSIPDEEIFGPVLHVVRFDGRRIDAVIERINGLGHGLTLGLHTRLTGRAERLARAARVGNVYVNRNMIGAVVGSQPFGGVGLSGTGPKAGGPHYLPRFGWEQTVSVNTAAIGGNASLLARSAD